MSKSKRKTAVTFTTVTTALTVLVGCLAFFSCIMMFIATRQSNLIKIALDDSAKNNVSVMTEYHTIAEVYENPDKFIGQYSLFCGYFCNEFATDRGVAWLSDQKEMSKDDAEHIIRLERSEVFEYTPKAIAVYGKLERVNNALVIEDGDFYLYGGTDKEMLKHNMLIECDVVNVVMTALRYEDKTDVSEGLRTLQAVACEFEDEDLEALLLSIETHSKSKETLSQDEFETKAEELWNTFRTQLLDR